MVYRKGRVDKARGSSVTDVVTAEGAMVVEVEGIVLRKWPYLPLVVFSISLYASNVGFWNRYMWYFI